MDKAKDILFSMEPDKLKAFVTKLGEPGFRAAQLFSWFHGKRVQSYGQMTNLPKAFRQKLEEVSPLSWIRKVNIQESQVDGTRKYLFALWDGQMIESVLMHYSYGCSVCVSSQVGCAMGCRFCASTIGGFVRNLTAEEMLQQVYSIDRNLPEKERISHIVIMGTGEPLLNLEQVLLFIRILSDEVGMHISKRNITVSTCGVVPEIYRLAEEKLPITLALSLHAPTQEKRRQIMPIADTYHLTEVIKATRDYFLETGRWVTYEYALIRGFNDRREDARELCELLRDSGSHVNLIALNAVEELSLQASEPTEIQKFAGWLKEGGINATIRRSLGADIDGACGQLRKKFSDVGNDR